jgi:hypothetical protein
MERETREGLLFKTHESNCAEYAFRLGQTPKCIAPKKLPYKYIGYHEFNL